MRDAVLRHEPASPIASLNTDRSEVDSQQWVGQDAVHVHGETTHVRRRDDPVGPDHEKQATRHSSRLTLGVLPERGGEMNLYTLFAISCYIILRGLQVLLEEHVRKTWYKRLIKTWTVVMLYAALVSLIVFYGDLANIWFLGFKAGD